MKKILQISDPHIGPKDELAKGIDVRSNFRKCLRNGIAKNADTLVITGDLCLHEGKVETYLWIRGELEKMGIPWFVIPGNHDDSEMMSRVFSLEEHYHPDQSEFYQILEWEQRAVFQLDTAKGDLSEVQREWLASELQRLSTSIEPMIFMHHPPVPLSVPYMDHLDIPSPNSQGFLELIHKCQTRVHVFVGHYHVDKTVQVDNLMVWACPSTYYQMSQTSEKFEIGDYRPGYRLIEIHPERLLVRSHYVTD